MPAAPPPLIPTASTALKLLGQRVRAHRKALRVSATAAAEAAGVSRVTLHRVEKGEPSVAVGAWANVMAALGLMWQVNSSRVDDDGEAKDLSQWLPVRVRLADYPQLKSLAWQVHGTDELSLVEALDIYERNDRHLDRDAMSERERALLSALLVAFGRKSIGHV
ncbi:MAG: helix-turn-helix domain-containing protein [Gammaproteobacteria bacterium]